jgi:hypothetical protein
MWHTWERRVYNLAAKPEGKRPLGRPRRRWENGIRMDLGEIGCGGMDSTGSEYALVASCCEFGDELLDSCAMEFIKPWLRCDTDHSPTSSAEVKNEYNPPVQYLLSH